LWQLTLKISTQSKRENVNNSMPIVIEFIGNTNFKIEMWIMKISCKFYIHKTRKHKILKNRKIKKLKMLRNPNNKLNLKFQYWGQNIVKGAIKGIGCFKKELEIYIFHYLKPW
jgi:hypothetical protein